jgi:hypothetical protein
MMLARPRVRSMMMIRKMKDEQRQEGRLFLSQTPSLNMQPQQKQRQRQQRQHHQCQHLRHHLEVSLRLPRHTQCRQYLPVLQQLLQPWIQLPAWSLITLAQALMGHCRQNRPCRHRWQHQAMVVLECPLR